MSIKTIWSITFLIKCFRLSRPKCFGSRALFNWATGKGSFLARHSPNLDWIEAKPAWSKLSSQFAKEATGDVHVFVNKATGASATSVWNAVERPILEAAQKTGQVGKIIVHAV
ncbi:MAG TPA: hypothetical protein VH374_23185 [Polyangia bacterium]|jgi:hypothetical protein|nr:hypothetical protein [Polyangia bacterium]